MHRQASVPERYLPVFCQELYQLCRAGITPSEGLNILREDETDRQTLRWLNVLCESAESGLPLSEVLVRSGAFPTYMTDMISLAEKTGRLEETFLALQRHYERKLRVIADIRNAITVPVVLLAVMLAVVVLLITQVLPVFDRVFAQLGLQLGTIAQGMLRIGNAISGAGGGILIAIGVLAAAVLAVTLISPLRRRFNQWVFRYLGGRGVLGQIVVSRFTSAMAMATSSGVDMEEAVTLSAQFCGGAREIDAKTAKCKAEIADGKNPADALSHSGLFTGRDCSLLKLADRTGSLPETLESLSTRQVTESLRRVDRIVASVEPAIVVVASVLVGVILLSVMLPMMALLAGLG